MPLRVLVVDDDEAVVKTLTRLLTLGGHEAVGILQFAAAKRYLADTPPDALVTDVRLGPYNGLQLAYQFRHTRPAAPIVVLSAWDDVTLRREAELVGATFLTKPIAAEDLLRAVGGN